MPRFVFERLTECLPPPSVVTHHGSDIVAGSPASIIPQIYYLRSVVSSFPVKAEIDWNPPHTTLFPSALY